MIFDVKEKGQWVITEKMENKKIEALWEPKGIPGFSKNVMAAKSQVLPKKYFFNLKGRNILSTKYNKIKSN